MAEELAHKVVQGDVYRRLGRAVAGREGIHIREDVFQLEGIAEPAEIHLLQEGAYALHALPEVGGHGGLAVAGEAVVVYLHLHVGGRRAGIGRYGEGVPELQFIGEEAQLHPGLAAHLVGFHGRAAAGCQAPAGHREAGCSEGGSLEKIASFHFRRSIHFQRNHMAAPQAKNRA